MCCLVETFPQNHKVLAEFKDTLELAFLYAKTVTLGVPKQWEQTARVMERNRRIGTSMSGIAQFICNRGPDRFIQWCDEGYNHLKECDKKIS